ncbi:MAG TPA: acyl-CoA dehydrogenase family protein [Solirubrobacteraceae bacterium]|nr:acyl-CoA dehydrogenase family protein [Solirubrobacteraceae bacterium]
MTVLLDSESRLLSDVGEIARRVAAPAAEEVDRLGRFPAQTVDALRERSALSAPVPEALGGAGACTATIAACCRELGRACGSSAMVFAMHHIQLLTIVRHAPAGSWFEHYLQRVCSEQRLIASVTSEVGTGGDMSRSIAAVQRAADGSCAFEKNAPTVSYGEHADDLLTTLRRSPEAEPGDQVAVLTHASQHTLEPTGGWDVLGMRGTCSPGAVVRAAFAPEQVLEEPFARVAAESMVPLSHVLWSHLWLGIAEDAFERARAFVRAAARRTPDQRPASATRLSQLAAELTLLRALVEAGLRDLERWSQDAEREQLSTPRAALRFNNLKLAASQRTRDVCLGALDVCGIMGYRNDSPYSVARHLRDALSAPLMIANERIHQTDAGLLLIAKEL